MFLFKNGTRNKTETDESVASSDLASSEDEGQIPDEAPRHTHPLHVYDDAPYMHPDYIVQKKKPKSKVIKKRIHKSMDSVLDVHGALKTRLNGWQHFVQIMRCIFTHSHKWYKHQRDLQDHDSVFARRKVDEKLDKYSWKAVAFYPALIPWVDNTAFEVTMAIPILFNCLTIAIAAECGIACSPEEIHQYTTTMPTWPVTNIEDVPIYTCEFPIACEDSTFAFLTVCEKIFTVFFAAEWCVRICIFGKKYFRESMNWFDTFLVWGTGMLAIYILQPLQLGGKFMRRFQVLRATRSIRIVRAVRTIPMFKDLWLMVRGLAESWNTMFWAAIMIFLVGYTFSILCVQIVGRARKADGQSPWWDDENSAHLAIRSDYKNIAESLFSFVQIMTLDSWTEVVRHVNAGAPGAIFAFLFFIMLSNLVLLNLIMAVIVNKTLDSNAGEEKAEALAATQKKQDEVSYLSRLFSLLDKDGSGTLSHDIFMHSTKIHRIQHIFTLLRLGEKDLDELFGLMDTDEQGRVNIAEICKLLVDMRGDARSKDQIMLQRKIARVDNTLLKLQSVMDGGQGIFDENGELARHSNTGRETVNYGAPPLRADCGEIPEQISEKECLEIVRTRLQALEEKTARSLDAMVESYAKSVPPPPTDEENQQMNELMRTLDSIGQGMREFDARCDDLYSWLTRWNKVDYSVAADATVTIAPRDNEIQGVPPGNKQSPNYFPQTRRMKRKSEEQNGCEQAKSEREEAQKRAEMVAQRERGKPEMEAHREREETAEMEAQRRRKEKAEMEAHLEREEQSEMEAQRRRKGKAEMDAYRERAEKAAIEAQRKRKEAYNAEEAQRKREEEAEMEAERSTDEATCIVTVALPAENAENPTEADAVSEPQSSPTRARSNRRRDGRGRRQNPRRDEPTPYQNRIAPAPPQEEPESQVQECEVQ